MELSLESMEVIRAMAETGNPNSVTDAGVGALCARAAVRGAFLNVRINTGSLKDKAFVDEVTRRGEQIVQQAEQAEHEIMQIVESKM